MAHIILRPDALDLLDRDTGQQNLNELLAQIDMQIDDLAIPTGSDLVGSSIGSFEVRGGGIFIVVTLRKADGSTLIHPSHDVFLHEGDTLIVMGH